MTRYLTLSIQDEDGKPIVSLAGVLDVVKQDGWGWTVIDDQKAASGLGGTITEATVDWVERRLIQERNR